MRYSSLPPIAVLALASMTLASVFVYYPWTILAEPVMPGVKFYPGTNAGKPDLRDKTIKVEVTGGNTEAYIEIHPTYQTNYYKDLLRVSNEDDDKMYVYLIFKEYTNTLPSNNRVRLYVFDGGTLVKMEDITAPQLNNPIRIGELAAGKTWRIDIYVYIPGDTTITGTGYRAVLYLAYTPSTETPPTHPIQ